jgi:hypothetical protein
MQNYMLFKYGVIPKVIKFFKTYYLATKNYTKIRYA